MTIYTRHGNPDLALTPLAKEKEWEREKEKAKASKREGAMLPD